MPEEVLPARNKSHVAIRILRGLFWLGAGYVFMAGGFFFLYVSVVAIVCILILGWFTPSANAWIWFFQEVMPYIVGPALVLVLGTWVLWAAFYLLRSVLAKVADITNQVLYGGE